VPVALFAVALSVTACVSMPSAGPVQSYPVTQAAQAQNQLYGQFQPQSPGVGWSPTQIVQGFLTASASFGAYSYIAKEYLTAQGRLEWNPYWSAIVYKSGPNVKDLVYTSPKKDKATVQIAGKPQAYLKGTHGYSVPAASAPDQTALPQPSFSLVKLNGQWRISVAPPELLLTSDSFLSDYQLSKLYFFDPDGKILIPDPVYVPLQVRSFGDLITGLVNDLITPPQDWLSGGATKTAFPPGTKISGVPIDGALAIINLSGTITKTSKASLTEVMQQVSAQLLFTLVGAAQSGQAVQSVEVELNGKPWVPPRAQGNPVQQSSRYHSANAPSPLFYAIDKAGFLTRRASTHAKPVRVVHVGTGFHDIAVSPSGKYLAALRDDGVLYTAAVGDPLVKRGTGYQAMSWDNSDQLWVSTRTQIFMLRGGANPQQPLGQPVPVSVSDPFKLATGPPYTSIRVAPDGVRVALISDSDALRFGAIAVQEEGLRAGQISIKITLSQVEDLPLSGLFNGLTWYGSDDVITLTDAPAVTEYPVSGAPYTAIPADTDLLSITASYDQPLVASLPGGRIVENVSLQGAWMPIVGGYVPAYPG
jgi:lipoprotein LpqB-like beta-propeller protein/sporulation and spore germination protein